MTSIFERTRRTAVLVSEISSYQLPLELWGGVECTFNRVGDSYFNQMEWSRHNQRLSDLDLFAEVGIKALRYPVIWEMLAPNAPNEIDWRFPDERLNRLRELGIRPIADLVHHGSGPRYAPIHTPEFAEGVGNFAHQVARRYPWLDAYTPINEPLTTARFCGRYGIWYPHGRSDETFVRVLINECRATVLAMKAVRQVNPQAQLIQTDDLGRVFSSLGLEAEADFQNERRWLGFDLLCGKVAPDHALWNYLLQNGIAENELKWFLDNPYPPDIIGINYYPTSDRYLDGNLSRYPEDAPAPDHPHYVDVEAIRVLETPVGGFAERLYEAWDRYHLPLSITEAHLGCTREEQVRWFYKAWQSADKLRNSGVDVRAVTAWSLLGAYNWNTLVTRDLNHYEPGVFDLRGPNPRPTALANLLRDLSSKGEHSHPLLAQPGWWERPMRLFTVSEPEPSWRLQPPRTAEIAPLLQSPLDKSERPLLIIGGTGTLGDAFAHACEMRALPYYALSSRELDVRNSMDVEMALSEIAPWGVINASGYVDIDRAESDEETCYAINTEATIRLARACAHQNIALLCFSSDQVFDGLLQKPYSEGTAPAPLNVYGRSKAKMEAGVLDEMPHALIARTSSLFSQRAKENFVEQCLRRLAAGEVVKVPEDVVISPTYVPDLVSSALDLLLDGAYGIWHLTNRGAISWAEFARQIARLNNLDSCLVQGCLQKELGQSASRPSYSVLGTERGYMLTSLEEAFFNYGREIQRQSILVV